jgi:hypothetical protein
MKKYYVKCIKKIGEFSPFWKSDTTANDNMLYEITLDNTDGIKQYCFIVNPSNSSVGTCVHVLNSKIEITSRGFKCESGDTLIVVDCNAFEENQCKP